MKESESLEISFRREMKQNYLMIGAAEELEHGFEARMLAANTIDGLLKFRVRRENDRLWFCYEISSKQPLSRMLDRTSITALQIRRLLLGIAQTLARMEDYLLSERLVLLDAEYIYVDPDEFQPGLCLLPGHQGDFPREFSDFLQFLLGKTDHQDKEAVVLIYGLYQESLKENYGLDNLLRWLMKDDYPNLEYRNEDEKSERIQMESEKDFESETVGGQNPDYGTVIRKKEARASPMSGRNPAVFGLLPVLTTAVLWLWRGAAGIAQYGAAVIGGSVVLAAVCAVLSVRTGGRNRTEVQADDRESWEMVFADERELTDERERGVPAAVSEPQRPPAPAVSEPPAEDGTHTALLWSRPVQTDIRRLAGEAGTGETIPISYYPFLIGKQENLADYILHHDTISRLHVRIDRKEDEYWLTDLNSTNGSIVNGRVLQANETVRLSVGDHVDLADLHFQFL